MDFQKKRGIGYCGLACVLCSYENGITYHKPDKSPGDYDVPETEDEIYRLLRYGRSRMEGNSQ